MEAGQLTGLQGPGLFSKPKQVSDQWQPVVPATDSSCHHGHQASAWLPGTTHWA